MIHINTYKTFVLQGPIERVIQSNIYLQGVFTIALNGDVFLCL